MTIYTELTPNPATLKFIMDKTLLATGVADFPTIESAKGQSKLAEKLYSYPFVQGVFIGRNFVTVTKQEFSNWEDVIPVVKDEISRFVATGDKIIEQAEAVRPADSHDELTQKIIAIIDENVRPAVAMDGGDIVFEGFEEGIVKLRLRGSCSGCPSSMFTLKNGIEALLKRMFPEDVLSVEAV